MRRKALNLLVTVLEIKGHYPVYQPGSAFKIVAGFKLLTHEPLCMHSLASLFPYYVALSRGINPSEVGLNREEKPRAYVQCLDPCEYTGGGTVIFEILVEERDEGG